MKEIKVGDNLKKAAWMEVLESFLTIVLGILLILWPDVVIRIIAYVVGVFLIVKGVFRIVNYFVVKGSNDFFNNDLLWGVIVVLVGITALIMGEEIAGVFRIIVGVWMIYAALVKMNTAIKLSAAKIQSWAYMLVISILMLVLGAIVVFNSGAVTVLVGWMMVGCGIIGMIGDIMFIQHVNEIANKLMIRG